MDWQSEHRKNEKSLSDYQLPTSFKSSRRSWDRKAACTTSNSVSNAISTLFNKQFELKNDNYTLPEPATMFTEAAWVINDLQYLKISLNKIKSKLNDYNLMKWRSHTRKRNRAGDIKWRLQREINPEFLTQAWCKFYEILTSFPLITTDAIDRKKIKSIHLCEAPGAFVTSLNHWLKLNAPKIDWKWTATTLNPYYEGNSLSCMLNDDRFILHTLSHWYFGTDNTGNLMTLKNLDDFVDYESEDRDDISLITADGSIDCLDMPEEQESIVSQLHYCETVAALHLLNIKGNFVIKLFTIFEYQTVCLIYLLSCCFNRVVIKKPATSKEGNSEVYVVALDFKGTEFIRPYLNILRQYYEEPGEFAMFRRIDIPDTFINQIVDAGKFFKYHQSQIITKNIETFGNKDYSAMKKIKKAAGDYFIASCGLRKLESNTMEIVGVDKLAESYCQVMDSKIFYDSYNDRQRKDHLPARERLQILLEELNCFDDTNDIFTIEFTQKPIRLRIITGSPYGKLQSSKFCQPQPLKIYISALEIANKYSVTFEYPCVKLITDYKGRMNNNTKELIFCYTIESENYCTIKKILETLDCLKSHQNLVLIGYPLLSQFNVGILYILAHTFECLELQINMDFGCIITLKNYLSVKNIIGYFHDILKASKLAEVNGEMILSVVPVAPLCDNQLYQKIMDVNHLTIKYIVHRITITIGDT